MCRSICRGFSVSFEIKKMFKSISETISRLYRREIPKEYRRKLLRLVADESVENYDQRLKADSRPLSKRDIDFFSRKEREIT